MAIYHFSLKSISRSSGRTATSSAAYRSGEKIYDERLCKVFSYPGKSTNVLFSEIMLPDKAAEWMGDREKLWNAVEAMENRKDSRLAREVELALPKELTLSENITLLKEYVNEQFIVHGLIADVNIHDQDRGNENIHAHVMITTRKVINGRFDEKKARDLEKKDSLLKWREEWANKVNYHLVLNGHSTHIDHRSYKEQGIDLVPQNKRGPEFNRKKVVVKTQEHVEIARQNGEKIYQDPKILLHALSLQQSTFTKQDIARFVNRHTADQEQFTRVFEKVYNSSELVVLGMDQKGNERYSYKGMVQLEKEMMDNAQILSGRYTHDVSNPEHNRLSMVASRAGRNIKEAFVGAESRFDYGTLSEEQKIAIEHITKGNDLSCVLGYAGTGKSYMLGAARGVWEREGYRVRGLSLTGIAARGLEDGSGIESKTITRQFRSWEGGRDVLAERDIVVLDEVGMVSSRQFHCLLGYVKEAGAKLVITGDFSQIPPIEAGAAARAVMEKIGYVELTEVRRQRELWQQEATKQLARGEIDKAIESYYQKGYVYGEKGDTSIQQQLLEKWAKNLTEQPDKKQIMVAFTNAEVNQLNMQAREVMSELGILGSEDHEVVVASGKLKIAEHEKILFLKNDYDLGAMNGMLGEISAINRNKISVIINKDSENQQKITFDINNYNHFTYGYAATVHKLQGATFDNVQVLVSKYFNRNIANVAFTRHRDELTIYHNCGDKAELLKVLNRDGSKDTSLDYPYLGKEILSYREIEPLGDLGYVAFHHRELVKELQLIGEKGVSFMTGREERGLIAGIVEHHSKQYVVLEQEKEFKLYNQDKFFHDSDEKELIESIGSFVTITKSWNESSQGFNAVVSSTGLSLLEQGEPYDAKEQNIFVLGRGVEKLQSEIVSLESQYHKPINFSTVSEGIYGVYRGSASVGEKEYGVVETASVLNMVSPEYLEGIESGKWITLESQKAMVVNYDEVPSEHMFDAEVKQTVLGSARKDSVVIDAAIYESKKEHYEVEAVRRILESSVETVVARLIGEPNAKLSSSYEWRYGNKGSLAISVAGDKRGLWHNFETGESGDLIKLIQKQTGMGFGETLKYASEICGGSYLILPRAKQISNKVIDKTVGKTSEYAQRLVAESKPIEETIVERYLKQIRGIKTIDGVDLRYHPKVFTSNEATQKYLPAMLSLGRDKEGNVQCVQATYLNPETANKAELDINKRTYASPSGALVYLQKQEGANKTSYIAEGVETGLSIKDAVGVGEVVVTLGKSNFAKIDPESVGQRVVLCLDNDGPNTFKDTTIHRAAERLMGFGKEVFIAVPESKNNTLDKKIDFNDIARGHGIEEVRDTIEHAMSYLEWKSSIDKEVSEVEMLPTRELQAGEVSGDIVNEDIDTPANKLAQNSGEPINYEQNLPEGEEKTVMQLVKEMKEIGRKSLEQETSVQRYLREMKEIAQGTQHDENRPGYNQEIKNHLEQGKDSQESFEREKPELAAKIDEEVSGTQREGSGHENASEQSLGARLEKIKPEAEKLLGSIKYCNSKQEEFKREGTFSPFLKETIEENKAGIVKCLREHCGRDKEMIGYIKTKEPQLFNEINKLCGNVLNNTLKQIESKELLEKLTQGQPELYKMVIAMEDKYVNLKQDYVEKEQLTQGAHGKAKDWDEYSQWLDNLDEAEKKLNSYANELTDDIELVRTISQHKPELFKEMDKQFEGLLTQAIKRSELHPEVTHTLAEVELSREERTIDLYEQYKDLQEDYLEKESLIHTKASDWDEYSQRLDNVDEAEKHLMEYAHEASQNEGFMDYLHDHDEKAFEEIKELNEKFNEMAREQMRELQHELERDI